MLEKALSKVFDGYSTELEVTTSDLLSIATGFPTLFIDLKLYSLIDNSSPMALFSFIETELEQGHLVSAQVEGDAKSEIAKRPSKKLNEL